MLNDPLSNVLSHVENCERIGRNEAVVKPISKLILKVLEIMKDGLYIGSYEQINNGRGGLIKINLIGKINRCNVIKPRLSFTYKNIEKFEKRFLPAKDFGIIIVSTNNGLMTHAKAKENKLGGKLIAFIY
ncbi:MAG: 30S ribosomal protein S8 [archaeon]